jgi:hypothetical protein
MREKLRKSERTEGTERNKQKEKDITETGIQGGNLLVISGAGV